MAELTAKSALAGLVPVSLGDVTISEVEIEALTSISPRKGAEKALSDALKAAHGMAAPKPGRATGKQAARAIWFGQGQVMLVGPAPEAVLGKHAALTDQTDAWAVLRIEGEGAVDVLARLVPVDLRLASFKRGHTARTQLQHMMVSITRIGDQAFQIMAFRSMAKTLVHDLTGAMRGVAARRGG